MLKINPLFVCKIENNIITVVESYVFKNNNYIALSNEIIHSKDYLDTSDATAISDDIKNWKTAYINGQKVTGSLESILAQTITPGANDIELSTNQKLIDGNYLIKGDPNLIPENILLNKTIFGVIGNVVGGNDLAITCNSDTMIRTAYFDDSSLISFSVTYSMNLNFEPKLLIINALLKSIYNYKTCANAYGAAFLTNNSVINSFREYDKEFQYVSYEPSSSVFVESILQLSAWDKNSFTVTLTGRTNAKSSVRGIRIYTLRWAAIE